MPRIRSLKPEHKAHRKVGRLSDFEYRLWVGMITEADDEGRLVAEPVQLRALIFPYQPDLNLDHLRNALRQLARTRLILRYTHQNTSYVQFPSWKDHQQINRPTQSKLPGRKKSVNSPLTEGSVSPHGGLTADRKGSDLIKDQGSDRKGGECEGRGPASAPESAPAPTADQPDPDGPLGTGPPPGPLAGSLAEFMATVRRAAATPTPGLIPRRRDAEAEV